MNKKPEIWKAVVVFVVVLMFVLPVSAFTAVERSVDNTSDGNNLDAITTTVDGHMFDNGVIDDMGQSSGEIPENSSTDWPMFSYDLRNTGFSPFVSAPDTNNLLWKYTTDGEVFASPVVADGKVFIGSHLGDFYCLDESNGSLIWNTSKSIDTFTSPLYANGKVFYVNSGDLYCLNASDGSLIWVYMPQFYDFVSTPVVFDGKVIICTFFGGDTVYCLNETDGSVIWSCRIGSYYIDTCPAVADGRIYIAAGGFTDYGGCVFCLDASDGSLIWRRCVYGEKIYDSMDSPVVADGRVYANVYNGSLFCLDAETGSPIWTHDLGFRSRACPAFVDGKLYTGSGSPAYFYCFDALNGSVIWKRPMDHRVPTAPAVADGKIFFGCYDNNVYCLDESDGSLIWRYATDGQILSSPAVANGRVFIGSVDKNVYCFGPPPDHDAGIISIDSPVSGPAVVITPEVIVKNCGFSNEVDVPVSMVITKQFETYLYEDFSDDMFPPVGWTEDQPGEWEQLFEILAGGKPPEAYLDKYNIVGNYSYLQSPPLDTTGATNLTLEFKTRIINFQGGYRCNVLIRPDSSQNWTDITPWPNPITGGVGTPVKGTYVIDVSSFDGTGTAVRFEFDGYFYNFDRWFIDDFYLRDFGNYPKEYDKTINIDIDAGETQVITFSDWTPKDIQYNIFDFVGYMVTSDIQLIDDKIPGNDCKTEMITLEYIHDVGVKEIQGLSRVPPLKGDRPYIMGASSDDLLSENFDGLWVPDDDGSPYIVPLGWDIDGICVGSQPGSPWATHYWTRFDDTHGFRLTHSAPYCAGIWWSCGNPPDPPNTAQDEWLITPDVDVTDCYNLQLEFYSIYMMGSSASFITHNYIKVSTDHGVTWDIIGDLCHGDEFDFPGTIDPRWNWNEFPVVIDLSMYDNSDSLMIAFHYEALDFSGRGIWMVDDVVLSETPPEVFTPGTYLVEAVIENYGYTYSESGFNVNATIYNMMDGKVFYHDGVVVTASVGPGDEVTVAFGSVMFLDADEGTYRLDVITELDGDDSSINNRQALYFTIGADTISPAITLEKENLGLLKYRFMANVSDPEPSSGIDRVEFYLDGELRATVFEDSYVVNGSYEWIYTGIGNHTVTATVYDNAGNNATSEGVTPHSQSQSTSFQLLDRVIQRIPILERIFSYFLG